MKLLIASFLASFLAAIPAGAAELLMFRSAGCSWCEVWENQIGGIYNKTDEAKILPLRRVDVDEKIPSDLKIYNAVFFTPTFVVHDKGKEIGRIIGYPGEEFFFPMLWEIINKLNSPLNSANSKG